MRRLVTRALRASLFTALLAACSSSSGGDTAAGDPSVFVAFGSSFDHFRDWTAYPLTGDAIPNSPHASGPRTIYLNHAPPHGSTEFPLGTIVVKEFGPGSASDGRTFAMVKRGGGYNAQGANGWEWFELKTAADAAATIVWRGVGPPLGETYGGDAAGGCNGCHAGARANDFVQASALTLSAF